MTKGRYRLRNWRLARATAAVQDFRQGAGGSQWSFRKVSGSALSESPICFAAEISW